eukprot:14382766-Heterocapsa_arctica.AAC.1
MDVRERRCIARLRLLGPDALPWAELKKHLAVLGSHHSSTPSDSAVLAHQARMASSSWQCGRCFSSHPVKHSTCSWCKIDKKAATSWQTIPTPTPA